MLSLRGAERELATGAVRAGAGRGAFAAVILAEISRCNIIIVSRVALISSNGNEPANSVDWLRMGSIAAMSAVCVSVIAVLTSCIIAEVI